MKFVHRLGYYLGGFAVGLIFLAFFLSGKKTSCDYGPDARVKKNIGLKEKVYTPEAEALMQKFNLDSTQLAYILKNGNVKFNESNTDLDSCKIYAIEDKIDASEVLLKVKNCDSTAVIFDIKVK